MRKGGSERFYLKALLPGWKKRVKAKTWTKRENWIKNEWKNERCFGAKCTKVRHDQACGKNR